MEMSHQQMSVCLLLLLCLTPRAVAADEARLADEAENGDGAAVSSLLEQNIDVDAAQVDGMTALHWAVYHDLDEMVELLLDAGAEPAVENRYGVTPLSLACMNGNCGIVERLLSAGADPHTTLRGGETVLMTAARTGKLGSVQTLLEHGAEVDATERNGQTALMWAAAEGHVDVVDALLDSGADFRAPLESGFTPLLFAVREGHASVVERLLEAGADVDEAMQPKKSFSRSPGKGMSALSLAIENAHFELALRLIEVGADPNDQRSGFTPLHRITWVRKPDSGENPDGDPPPAGSGQVTSLQFVRELIARGADVNAQLKKGRSGRGDLNLTGATPFLMAAKTADTPLLRLLVELGADPLLTNVDGSTPLMAAAGLGALAPPEHAGTEPEALEALQFMLELGGDVNAVDQNGETAMHGAAYKSFPEVVQFLADNGADIEIWNRENRYGWTPLLIAEGYRPGNFKPSAETITALHRVMRSAGVEPPTDPKPVAENENYN